LSDNQQSECGFHKCVTAFITRLALIAFVFVGTSVTRPLNAQGYSADKAMGPMAQQLPGYLQHAGIEQHLNQPLPLAAVFTDETGRVAPLSQWIGKRPAVIALVYYKCTMMCPEVLHGLATGLKQTTLIPGQDYDVVTFSIDPTDTPADGAKEKANFVGMVGLPGTAAATHCLTGTPASIDAISASTGFQYVRVPGPDGKLDQFAHSSIIMFATPDGRLSKYISGIEYPPRDLRLAILDASQKKISNPVDLFLIYCCSYNPAVGKYSVTILRVVSIAGMLTLAGILGMFILLRRSSRNSLPA
jgi:protein SCO1/2